VDDRDQHGARRPVPVPGQQPGELIQLGGPAGEMRHRRGQRPGRPAACGAARRELGQLGCHFRGGCWCRGGCRCRGDRPGLAGQDPFLPAAEFRARLDAQLLDQRPAGILVGLQRLRLPAGVGQRLHELGMQVLAQRVLSGQLVQLGHQPGVLAELEVSLDAVFEHLQPELFQPRHELVPQHLAGHVEQGFCAPQPQRLGRRAGRGRPLGGAQRYRRVLAQRLERKYVEVCPGQLDQVPGLARPQLGRARAQRAPQPPDVAA
jgi:hypothetical protein